MTLLFLKANNDYLVSLFRMGSFTSMPKIRPAPNSEDNDVEYDEELISLEAFLLKCRRQLGSLPSYIPRGWRGQKTRRSKSLTQQHSDFSSMASSFPFLPEESVRVFQWNALSQG